MIDPLLAARTVLITGANNPHGIGAAIAKAFAAAGAKLFLHYFREPLAGPDMADVTPDLAFYREQQSKSMGEVIGALQQSGACVGTFEADLADALMVPKLFAEAERACGPVEVLVNNAATWTADTFIPESESTRKLWPPVAALLTSETFDRQFFVNTRAPVLLMVEFAKRHVERSASWGRIIDISTDGAECFPSEVSYGASKLALESYTRSAAAELGQVGITVNAVALGPVQTGWITPDLERALIPTIPLRRIGQPADIADVVVFLASDQARWITGQRIVVGGGHRI